MSGQDSLVPQMPAHLLAQHVGGAEPHKVKGLRIPVIAPHAYVWGEKQTVAEGI